MGKEDEQTLSKIRSIIDWVDCHKDDSSVPSLQEQAGYRQIEKIMKKKKKPEERGEDSI